MAAKAAAGKTAVVSRAARRCACGCKTPTARTFAQGHDSKTKSLLLKVERGELRVSDLPLTLHAPELRKGRGLIARTLRKVLGGAK